MQPAANVRNGSKADVNGRRLASPIEVEYYSLMARTQEYYREEAERCRKMAQDVLDSDTKANLLDVARQYDKLAAQAAQNFEASVLG